MKKLLLLILLPFLFSCTNYYYVTMDKDTPLYSSQDSTIEISVIPAGTQAHIKGNKAKKYRKVKYNGFSGYAINPSYTIATPPETTTNHTRARYNTSSNSTPSAGKKVHVKGYTRKDGTYVKPHTRSAPRKH
jgi:hypothetical protein